MPKKIDLGNGKYSLIDDDMVHLNNFKWFTIHGYAVRTDNDESVTFRLHREVLGVSDDKVHVDHINGDRLDNRRCNLRLCTVSENAKNKRRQRLGKTSEFKGVSKYKNTDRWIAQISVDKEKLYLGIFDKEIDAARAYDYAAKLHHRDFESSNSTILTDDRLDWSKFEILPRATTCKTVYTYKVKLDNGMIFETIESAAKWLNVKPNTIVKAVTDKSMIRRVRGFLVEYGEKVSIEIIL